MGQAQSLTELFKMFRDEAMRIDPTIKEAWLYTDETMDGSREKRLAGIQFVREHKTKRAA